MAVHPESLDTCIAAMHEIVVCVCDRESGALRYEVWQVETAGLGP